MVIFHRKVSTFAGYSFASGFFSGSGGNKCNRNTCCTSRGRYSKQVLLCWNKCKRATDSHRWKQNLESSSLRCRLWCFSVKPWLSSYPFGMYLFPPEGKGRDASGDSGCRGMKLWHLILVGAFVWAWKMSSKCDSTVALWIIVSNFESRFRITVLGVLKGARRERATRFRSRLKTLAVVSRRQLKPLHLLQRLLFHDSGEKPFVEATSLLHDELTFCQMDSVFLTEWSTVRRQRRRHQQLRHEWVNKQRGACCWTCSINKIVYLASWKFSVQRILFFGLGQERWFSVRSRWIKCVCGC